MVLRAQGCVVSVLLSALTPGVVPAGAGAAVCMFLYLWYNPFIR